MPRVHKKFYCMADPRPLKIQAFNTRTPGGGVDFRPPPLRFFADNAKTAARSAAALGIAVHSSFPHIVSKFWPRVMSGQVSRSR